MRNKLTILINTKVEEVIASSLSLDLLKIYSLIYLNGGAPRICASSQRKYYEQIKKDLAMIDKILNRKCVPAFDGLKYIPGVFNNEGKLIGGHIHVYGASLSDEKARELLALGALKESDFITLPPASEKEIETGSDLVDIVNRGDFNEMLKTAKAAGFTKKSPKKADLKEFLLNKIDGLV